MGSGYGCDGATGDGRVRVICEMRPGCDVWVGVRVRRRPMNDEWVPRWVRCRVSTVMGDGGVR